MITIRQKVSMTMKFGIAARTMLPRIRMNCIAARPMTSCVVSFLLERKIAIRENSR